MGPDRRRSTLDLVATGVFAATGALTGSVLATAAWCLPGLIIGGLAGYHARSLLSPRRFRMLVLGLLVLTGSTAVAAALT
jgi:uncharacterized membrane protein YfcA